MALLGLTSSNDLTGHFSLKARRKIFHRYPNGGFPLAGLLSILEDDPSDKAEFDWYEKEFPSKQTQLATAGGTPSGPFQVAGGGSELTDPFTLAALDITRATTIANGTINMRVSHVVWLRNVPLDGGVGSIDIRGVITSIPSTTEFEFQVDQAFVAVSNDDTDFAAGIDGYPKVIIIGTANPEGGFSGQGRFTLPVLSTNFTQIFKSPFDSTGTSIKAGMIWDSGGHFEEKAQDALNAQMTEIELAILFGKKGTTTVDQGSGTSTPRRTMNGVLSFLEALDVSNGVTGDDEDPLTRVIKNTDGLMSYKQYNTLLKNLFDVTNNKEFSKLCLCDGTHLQTVNDILDGKATFNTTFLGDDKFKFSVVEVETLHGLIYYKTHPLLNQNSTFKGYGMYLDVLNLKLRSLNDRDTQLHENIQANDADFVKHQYVTEMGLENIHTQSHMVIENLVTAVT